MWYVSNAVLILKTKWLMPKTKVSLINHIQSHEIFYFTYKFCTLKPKLLRVTLNKYFQSFKGCFVINSLTSYFLTSIPDLKNTIVKIIAGTQLHAIHLQILPKVREIRLNWLYWIASGSSAATSMIMFTFIFHDCV